MLSNVPPSSDPVRDGAQRFGTSGGSRSPVVGGSRTQFTKFVVGGEGLTALEGFDPVPSVVDVVVRD